LASKASSLGKKPTQQQQNEIYIPCISFSPALLSLYSHFIYFSTNGRNAEQAAAKISFGKLSTAFF
jgi:hypothetical protein